MSAYHVHLHGAPLRMPTASPPVSAPAPQRARRIEYDQYIDQQIRRTRGTVKLVDLASRLMTAVVGLLAALLVAALVEHWLVPGGFSVVWRSLAFVGLLLAASWYAWREVIPLILQRISPVYAARAIESHSPGLKNTLLNLLLFRQHRDLVPDAVYRTVEEQAATRLATADVDAAVDRSGLIRVGYLLLGLVLLGGLYKVLSPKDPVATAGRVLMPWADIPVPTRVSITNIDPGESIRIARGESVDVSAAVSGLREGESIALHYSTEDGQAVNLPVEMVRNEGEYRYRGQLPADPPPGSPPGVQQPMTYYITAGDARSKVFAIEVIDAPTIVIERLEYDYPEYTGLADRTQTGEGSIRAIEGTRVTVHAQTNHAIRTAGIDLGADGSADVRMDPRDDDPLRAFGELQLELDPQRRTLAHDLYALLLTDQTGQKNRRPVHYRIEVIPDLRPEVEILQPTATEAEVRLGESVQIEVEARDPDYALLAVRILGRTDDGLAFEEPLLEGEHRGRFTKIYSFTPAAPEYAVGDVVEYWVEAEDVRTPEPNRAATQHRRLKIVEPPPVKEHPALEKQGQGGGAQQQQTPDGQRPDQQPQQNEGEKNQEQRGEGGGAKGEPQQDPNAEAGGEQQQQGDGTSDAQPQPGQQDGSGGQQGTSDADRAPEGGQSQEQPQPNGEPQNAAQGEKPQEGGVGAAQGADGEQAPAGGEQSQQQGQPGDAADPNAATEPSGAGGAADQSPPQPVPADGTDDATAIERMREHFQGQGDKQGQNQGQAGSEESGGQNAGEKQAQGEKTAGQDQDGPSQTPRDQQAADDANRQGEAQTAEQRQANRQTKEQRQTDQQPATPPDGAEGEAGTEGTPSDDKRPQPGANESQPSRPNESQGDSGAGNQTNKDGGAPSPSEQTKPREKLPQQGSEAQPQDPTEAPAPAQGRHDSDSQGDQGGERKGGAHEGGGDKADRVGTGSPGQNQSADEGAGSTGETGTGDTSNSPGGAQNASEPTGQPGDQKGRGTGEQKGQGNRPGGATPPNGQSAPEQRSPEEGNDSGEQQQPQNGGPQAEGDPRQQPQQGRPQAEGSGQPVRGNPTSGGLGDNHPDTLPPPPPTRRSDPVGDEGNLEYARKQTDLVLDRLENQLKEREVDEDLLDKLGWSEADLKKFVDRWKHLKQAAQREGADSAAQSELDKALGALGLSRRPVNRQSGTVQGDQDRNFRDAGGVRSPVEFEEEVRAYTRGISE
jgi:hypothetical protein